jgi:peroxiredoxin
MKKLLILPAILFLFIAAAPSETGFKVGDKAADFNLKNVDGKMVSLAGLKNNKGAIVIFTCNHCPFSVAYEDRIIALHNKYAAQGYPVVAINPNDPVKSPDDSFDAMVVRAAEKKFPFPYIYDVDQKVASVYGAVRTPHVFVLTREENAYNVAYIGAIDDNTYEPENVQTRYVEQALDEILAGKKVTTNFTKAIGCTIKWKS